MSWKLAMPAKTPPEAASITPPSEPSLLSSTPGLPGILTVTLHEGVGFSAAEQYRHLFEGYERNLGTPDRPSYRRQFHLPYALLDYEKSQVSVDSILGSTENPRWGVKCGVAYKFDVCRAAALAVHLYLKNPKACKGSQDVFLGVARVNPFDGSTVSGPQWLDLQDGTGKVLVSLEYTQADIDLSGFTFLDVFQAEKKNTQRKYARKAIRAAQLGSFSDEAAVQISHPFIALLAFACQSPKGLELFAPFISGGHLLNHLQRPQRFDIDRAKLYAAEILCALEYLHDAGIVSWLKPGNVMLDSRGHVTLCGFGLFTRQFQSEEQVAYRRPEYPAPELLLDERSTSKVTDWWTLGVLLFEMLTGLPPFYDNDTEKMRRNILDQPLEFPEPLPPSATDILTKLLDREPGKRLGAAGAAEVKAHPFFEDIDWQKLFERGYEPVFKPGHYAGSFRHHGVDYPPERWLSLEERLPQFAGFTYTRPQSNSKTTSSPPGQPPVKINDNDDRSNTPQEPPLPTTAPPLPPSPLEENTPLNTLPSQDRLTLTKAVAHATSTNNLPLATSLLTHSAASPNFHPSDIPLPRHPLDNGCYFDNPNHDYKPPLISAILHGNLPMVKLLLAYGADADTGYHELAASSFLAGCYEGDTEPVRFRCGRAVLLAMELGYEEVVRVLVERGADVGLGVPVWEEARGRHECVVVRRGAWLRVLGGLRGVVAEVGRGMGEEGD